MKCFMKDFDRPIELWSFFLPHLRDRLPDCRRVLSRAERERADSFRRSADAECSVLSRGLLRKILAEALNRDPAQLEFVRNDQGKPFLKDSGGLEFNVSHSRDRLLIAVTHGRAVGVDIEYRRSGVHRSAIAERWFSSEERSFFKNAKHPERVFFDIWSKKEACVKALGTGIFKELSSFTVPYKSAGGRPVFSDDKAWVFQSLEIDPAYAAALVWASDVHRSLMDQPAAELKTDENLLWNGGTQ
jgi:4'-phosphopantetheinyl transferase